MTHFITIVGFIASIMTILGIDGIFKFIQFEKKIKAIENRDEEINNYQRIQDIDYESNTDFFTPLSTFPNLLLFKITNGTLFYINWASLTSSYDRHKYGPFNPYGALFLLSIVVMFINSYFRLAWFSIFLLLLLIKIQIAITRVSKQKFINFIYDRKTKLGNEYFIGIANRKCVLLNNSYDPLTLCVFDSIDFFIYKNLLLAKKDNKFGLLNFDGSVALPFIYDNIRGYEGKDYITAVKGQYFRERKTYRISKFGIREIDSY